MCREQEEIVNELLSLDLSNKEVTNALLYLALGTIRYFFTFL